MKSYPIFVISFIIIAGPIFAEPTMRESSNNDQFETRCGWFVNPTPANISLYDRDGEWIIGVQGGYQVEGDWEWPSFAPGQWVKTNVNYGYGCACLDVQVNRKTKDVLAINNARPKPLKACRQDRSLNNKWKGMFK